MQHGLDHRYSYCKSGHCGRCGVLFVLLRESPAFGSVTLSSVADQILFEILEELRAIRKLLESPDDEGESDAEE